MMRIRLNKTGLINLFVLIIFSADRLLKYYFLKNPAGVGGDFFYPWLKFGLAKNYGIAFSLPISGWCLISFIVIVIFILVYFWLKAFIQKNIWFLTSLTLIIVGAISNLIDRLRFGYVIDYIDVPWFTVFNLADSLITIGAAILILSFWFNKKQFKKI
jgi:signal peptidase II